MYAIQLYSIQALEFRCLAILIVVLNVVLGGLELPTACGEEISYSRDIRPLLSDKCFRCHGPDDSARQGDLRLDDMQLAVAAEAIVPGDEAASSLVQRITTQDAELRMPPPGSGKQLSAAEIATLQQWIASGAKFDEHWAFVPPQRPDVPAIAQRATIHNPIDNFIASSAAAKGLLLSAPADRSTLIRRLFLDLVGLPPSPTELSRWNSAVGNDWSRQLVEELLRSPHFGERWARWWLDAARYSDSDGYEKDKPREVWFYRDWVIAAMNEDMPYDQFIIRQIAGDLLPQATQADRVATGFLRNSMVNEEGGADPEQFRVEGLFDRLDAIGKAILGITTQCAQCHTHKYDPLTQLEYYQMLAALNDDHEAIISVYTPQQQEQRKAVLEQIAAIERDVQNQRSGWRDSLAQWHQQLSKDRPQWQTLVPTELPWEGQKFRALEDGSIISESYAPTRNDISFPCQLLPGTYTAVRLDLLTHPQLPHGGPGRSIYGTGALTQFDVKLADDATGKKTALKFRRAVADVNPPRTPLPTVYRERDPSTDQRVTGGIEMAVDNDGLTAWSTDVGPRRSNQDRHAIFEFETPLVITQPTTIWLRMLQNHGGWNSDDNQNYLMGRYRFSITQHPQPAERVVSSELEPLLARDFNQLNQTEVERLFSFWLTAESELDLINQQIEALWQQHPRPASQLAVIQRDKPRETYVMLRGDFLKRGPRAEPGVPEFLNPAVQSDQPPRLRFAQWLVDRQSPTTARVVVNRIWQTYFGRGLVATPEDFGRQSPAPTHPQLLDWLAVELMDNGWSLRHIHRLIVNSATYQRSSATTAEQLELDPQNQWLARGPRFRLEAEIVRDVALSVSGLLNDTLGGPSVYPPAPAFLFVPPASYGPKVWNESPPDQQYRRSLYVHSFRSVPYPPLQVFDSPKGDGACIRRERSNTPLQALVLLNEPQFVECARGLALRILREASDDSDESRIRFAHQLVTGRMPKTAEIAVVAQVLEQQRQRMAASQIDVAALVGTDQKLTRQLTGFSPEEILPWIVVARVLLNLDETITKG
ncbi:MAG: PSD1 domain-containing protein [Pirellulaceae bacterium]|nr:PSD1 domain-containing protein [Pirellulaceae bacterium]